LLLEDLQSSVSRPGSSLGNLTNGHMTTSTTTTTRRQQQQNAAYPQQQLHQHHQQQQQHTGGIQYLQPMNSTTVVTERASSPGRTVASSYKTYQYQYQTSSAGWFFILSDFQGVQSSNSIHDEKKIIKIP
jgi:hypothetical protein